MTKDGEAEALKPKHHLSREIMHEHWKWKELNMFRSDVIVGCLSFCPSFFALVLLLIIICALFSLSNVIGFPLSVIGQGRAFAGRQRARGRASTGSEQRLWKPGSAVARYHFVFEEEEEEKEDR